MDNLETWIEFQVGQLGTPAWWEELGAVPGIEDQHEFTQKIRVSFYGLAKGIPRPWLHCTSAPQILNRGTFHPERFTYQDVRQQPVLLTITYARCLQH